MEERTVRKHRIRTSPKNFWAIQGGAKNFKICKTGEEIQLHDILVFQEWTPETGYTGQEAERSVGYIEQGDGLHGLAEGYCVIALKRGRPTATLDEMKNSDPVVYVYQEYNDDMPFGEMFTTVFSSRASACDYLAERVTRAYGEPPKKLAQCSDYADDDIREDYVSIVNDGGDTSYFSVTEHRPVRL